MSERGYPLLRANERLVLAGNAPESINYRSIDSAFELEDGKPGLLGLGRVDDAIHLVGDGLVTTGEKDATDETGGTCDEGDYDVAHAGNYTVKRVAAAEALLRPPLTVSMRSTGLS